MLEIKVDLDKKCKKCGEGGATQNGYCLPCITKEVKSGKFDHQLKAIEEVVKQTLKGGNNGKDAQE